MNLDAAEENYEPYCHNFHNVILRDVTAAVRWVGTTIPDDCTALIFILHRVIIKDPTK